MESESFHHLMIFSEQTITEKYLISLTTKLYITSTSTTLTISPQRKSNILPPSSPAIPHKTDSIQLKIICQHKTEKNMYIKRCKKYYQYLLCGKHPVHITAVG